MRINHQKFLMFALTDYITWICMDQAPIIHVNGDDVEAVVHACDLAVRWRQEFRKVELQRFYELREFVVVLLVWNRLHTYYSHICFHKWNQFAGLCGRYCLLPPPWPQWAWWTKSYTGLGKFLCFLTLLNRSLSFRKLFETHFSRLFCFFSMLVLILMQSIRLHLLISSYKLSLLLTTKFVDMQRFFRFIPTR